jgi:flavin reductase (DIM6/NTAB) family NADH-FMN oxidoreductase RutF
LCRTLAVGGAHKFPKTQWTPAAIWGSPRIIGARAWVDIEVGREVSIGAHVLVVGQVFAFNSASFKSPLIFYRGRYQRLTMANSAT